ncbi:MAG TPA: hypothetical protein VK766_07780 [Cytophagaceae bacterium]|jgi:hypothetical protein|nr:hypothetical protein [Cytophagaceae bacterium]
MLRYLLTLFLIFQLISSAKTQTLTDTTHKVSSTIKPTFWNTIYLRSMPVCVYTGAGYLKDRTNQNFEMGKSFKMIDVGMAVGRNALRRDSLGDGNVYMEAKFTMDIAQYGIFSNEMVVGAGYVFNAQNFLMLELSYTIYAQFWKHFGIGIVTGYYDFSGNTTDNARNMFGFFCRYGLNHSEGGLLNNISRMNRTHMHHGR